MGSAAPRELSLLGMVACLGTIFLGGWLAWCAAFQFASIPTEAELIRTRAVHYARSKERKAYDSTYGIVRYTDAQGKTHEDEVGLYGGEIIGHKISVRYHPSRPDDCYRDGFWGIWGLVVMVSGVFALIVGLTWYFERKRLPKNPHFNPFDQTTP
jgi:hypothetical protein